MAEKRVDEAEVDALKTTMKPVRDLGQGLGLPFLYSRPGTM